MERLKISYFLDNAEDTVKGATYLVNQNPDVAIGNKYVGSTETAATAMVA